MGSVPRLSRSTFARSLSTQTTSLPRSAKTAPVTSPTYPVPTTQMFIGPPRNPSRMRNASSYPERERVAHQPLPHHDHEQQQQVEVREQEQRQPPALILGPAREHAREPDQS